MSKLKREIKKPLSNIDLQDLLNDMNGELGEKKKINIFTVPEMKKNPKLFMKKLNDNHYSIIFINPSNQPIGHWSIIYKSIPDNNYYFFDSYGKSPEYYDKNLFDFLKKHLPTIKYNTIQYQKVANNVNTCGRYSTLIMGLNRIIQNLTPEKIKTIMNNFKKENKMNYDEIVTSLVNFDL